MRKGFYWGKTNKTTKKISKTNTTNNWVIQFRSLSTSHFRVRYDYHPFSHTLPDKQPARLVAITHWFNCLLKQYTIPIDFFCLNTHAAVNSSMLLRVKAIDWIILEIVSLVSISHINYEYFDRFSTKRRWCFSLAFSSISLYCAGNWVNKSVFGRKLEIKIRIR